MRATAADHRWGMVAAGAALIGTCYGLARFGYGLFAPQFQAEFAITSTVSGVISAGSYVGYCVAIVVSLVLTERLGARRVAVAAGAVATLGTATVALAPSATVLAVGVLVAGASTGLASPPLAAAVNRWVQATRRDRAQTVVNAGTGVGVVVSGPVALIVTDDWRAAWATFAVLAALVTFWVFRALPASDSARDAVASTKRWAPGAGAMLLGAFLMGVGSMAMWTFGQDLIATSDDAGPRLPGLAWTVLGAAGIAGALAGDAVHRIGLATSWRIAMVLMGSATLLLMALPDVVSLVLVAVAVFGASYLALTGVQLVWGTRVFPDRASYGVTLAFLMIAFGQVVGAVAAGALADATGLSATFVGCALVCLAGALVRPTRS